MTRGVGQRRRPRRAPRWVRLSDQQLLSLRFCDLELTLDDTEVERRFAGILRQLERRGLRFRPHLWLSEEWFSPDGIPGVAVAFYMAHPRLMQLERRLMREAEPPDAGWLTRILRHEVGHAVDNAFRLRRRKSFRQTFGRPSQPYTDVYRSRPTSRDFVLHLRRWYAQSHPTEDFAETFAVWLQPRARWRREYEGWPALRKLLYVDALMEELSGRRPPVTSRKLFEPLHENQRTLREHYDEKLERCVADRTEAYDRQLQRVFARRDGSLGTPASTFLRQSRPDLKRLLTRRARAHPYVGEYVVHSIIQRCFELDLSLPGSRREAKREVLGVLERMVTDVVRRDRERYHR